MGYPPRVIPALVRLADPIGSVREIEALSKIGASETGGWGEVRSLRFLLIQQNSRSIIPYMQHSNRRYAHQVMGCRF